MKTLTPAERLIVAADYKSDPAGRYPTTRSWVRTRVIELAQKLDGTGVYIKINSALRALGYNLIDEIHSHSLKVFADLKLCDIGETLSTDGVLLKEAKPDLLTVMCSTGSKAILALKKELPETEILGVTVLTSMDDTESTLVYGQEVEVAARKLARLATESGLDGIICSAKEAEVLRKIVGEKMTINTPAIRPTWAIVKGDDQNPERIMTPAKAIKAGADRIVVGRPIVRDSDPRLAAMRTIEEIEDVAREPSAL